MWSVRGLRSGVVSSDPSVTVIIPARNEANRLPRLLASLADQTAAPTRMIVVDDASEDATAEVARAAGATVVSSTGPPDGWAGKTWACHRGVETAELAGEDLVAIIDADVWLDKSALARLVATHRECTPGGLLSVEPYHVTDGPSEQLSAIPNLVAVMASGLAAAREPSTSPVAFGPCLVTTAGALAAVGGFASVRAETVEDIALARRYRAAELPVRCFAGRDLVRFRMYEDGLMAQFQGWTKNLAGGAGRAAWAPLIGTVAWICGAAAVGSAALTRPSLFSAVLWLLVAVHLAWMLRRIGRFQPWIVLGFPIGVAWFIMVFGASIVRRSCLRSVRWSGRTIPIARR